MNSIQDQLSAYGVAQIIVVLKSAPPSKAGAKPSAALAAAMPVAREGWTSGVSQSVVKALSKNFKISEMSMDTALAASAKSHKLKTSGTNWYRRAALSTDPTPPVRFFPNLGVMLGTVDKTGLAALKAHSQVDEVVAPPVLSLIRPVSVSEVKPKKQQYTWGILRLKADQLHKQGITGKGIIVGHLDTGADGKHPALKSAFRSFAEFDDLGFQVTPAPQPHDTDEHGTHTAGTIAGRTIAGRAIGVAPDAKLASAIVIEGGNVNARILAGMDWVIGQGARILSMSLGIRGYVEDFLSVTQILRARGVLPVFAVGNEGAGTSRSPGNYAETLSVGAMDENDKVADFSSSRRFNRPDNPLVPDVVAPGVNTISAKPDGGYQSMDGSSMATPHIAGLAALLMQAVPAATIDQIEDAIFKSCVPLPGQAQDRQNRGVPNAVQALALLGGPAAVGGRPAAHAPAAGGPRRRRPRPTKKRAIKHTVHHRS